MNKLKIIEDLKNHIKTNNIPIPLNIKDYDNIVKGMKGFSRAWLCKNGIKCAKDILPFLNPEHIDKSVLRFDKYKVYAEKLGLVISLYDNTEANQTCKLYVKCVQCNFEEVITAHSLMRRTLGCKRCSHQSKWDTREEEFIEVCKNKNIRLFECTFSEIDKLKSSKIKLLCNKCNNIFERTFINIIDSRYATNCPVCHPPKIYGKMGVKAYFNSIEFSSEFEADVYKTILNYIDEKDILVHVPYTKFVKDCSYISDFVLYDDIVLEVSSFNLANHLEYANKIEKKRSILQNTRYTFVFCNTLAEVEDLIQSII